MLFIELHDQLLGKEQATKLLEEIEGLGFQRLCSSTNTYVFESCVDVLSRR